jgi:hypothetical protein
MPSAISTLSNRLSSIESNIGTTPFHEVTATTRNWGGADVIIAEKVDDRIKRWLAEQPLVISDQQIEPLRRAVITPCAKELSWLFYQLLDAFRDHMDSVSKYDLYGLLAQAAIDFIRCNEGSTCESLLREVLETAKAYAKDL